MYGNKSISRSTVEMILLSRLRWLTIALVGAASLSGELTRVKAQPTTSAQEETARSLALYQQGQNEEAVKSLRIVVKRNKNDVHAWHSLGLALEKKGDVNEALKAHEKAAKLGDQLLNQLDQASRSEDVRRVGAEIRNDADAIIENDIAAAAKSAERYVALNATLSKSKREEWQTRILSLQGLADVANADSGIGRIYRANELTEKVKIFSKPEPPYTEEARRNKVSGTVVLKVIFSAYGRVIGIRAISGLPDGLTERAIRAARQIRFRPALKDGKPVSMYAQLEYHFTVF